MEKEDGDREPPQKRHKSWQKNVDFVITTIGSIIGLGNVWRFPYVCYKNGGGAFLIAYIVLLAVMCFPCMVLECALGQHAGRSTVEAWKIVPIMRGIGIFGPIAAAYANVYYPVILAWATRWLVGSFFTVLPWSTCNNTWNTLRCVEVLSQLSNVTMNETTAPVVTLNGSLVASGVSSIEEFWRHRVLGVTSSIEEPGELQWDLLGCLLFVWILTYFTLWKGIGWTSKVIYFTATLPIIMLVIILVRGLTLQGASKGIELYLKPNLTKLGEPGLWHDAASQITFSFGIGCGVITTISAHNQFHHNFFRDLIILASANAAASFMSGFAIFSTLGYLAHSMNASVVDVATYGPGLVFEVYPTALSLLPLPNFWCALFFLMLILLGLDSQFVWMETLMASLGDLFPSVFNERLGRERGLAVVSLVTFVFGIPLVTGAGVYALNLFDAYAATGWCILFAITVEFLTVGWVYGDDAFCADARTMLGYNIPRWWFKICAKFAGPILAAALLILSLLNYKPLGYKGDVIYPAWTNAVGWIMALSSVLWIPGTAIYVVYNADGTTLVQKIRNSLQPTNERRSEANERAREDTDCSLPSDTLPLQKMN